MKAVVGIGILQILVTALLLYKVVSLETSVAELQSRVAVSVQHRTIPEKDLEPNQNISLGNDETVSLPSIRALLKDELELALSARTPNERLIAIEPTPQPTDPELIREFESRIEYYLSDGSFTHDDMLDLENQIIKMAPQDRPKMMNKLTQAMSKANIQLIE